MEKIVNPNKKDWPLKHNDALWVYSTTFKMPLGMSPYRLIYDKPCHLHVKLEHKSFWAIKVFNSNLNDAGNVRKLQLKELKELRNYAYENSRIIKAKIKLFMIKDFFRKHLRLVKKCYLIILAFIRFQES